MEKFKISPSPSTSDTFKFKYVAEEDLLRIVRKVRRERQKEKDATYWKHFVEKKEQKSTVTINPEVPVEPATSSCLHCNKPSIGEKIEDVERITGHSECSQDSPTSELDGPPLLLRRTAPNDGCPSGGDTGALQRVILLRHRISLALDSITGMIQCQPVEPDGPDDLERRRTRINEFLSRFSRNYLFQFQRQVSELRRHIVCASTETPGRHTEYQFLLQKLVSAHQTAVQSLQAYLTQIPASLQVTNIFGKLRELLYHLCDLSSLKNQLDVHAGLIDGYEDMDDLDGIHLKCKYLLQLLEEKQAEVEDTSLSARPSSPVSARGSMNPRTQRNVHRTSGGTRHSSWKKTSAHLARAKFGAPSSVRSSASARIPSSRDCHSQEEKHLKDTHNYSCCNSELKEILTHMHDVLCNKYTSKKKNKSKHHSRSDGNSSTTQRRKSHGPQKQQTLVQNLSKNVQLVLTQHCESDPESRRDIATDTHDLLGDNRKNKKVGWATGCSVSATQTAAQNQNERSCINFTVDTSVDCGDCRQRQWRAPEQRMHKYRQRFLDYNSKVQNPAIQRWCEDILDGVLHGISEELEPSFLLEKMYHLEFKD